MHSFSPWLALLIVFVYSHKFCDRYTFLFSQQPISCGQPPSDHRLWFPIGFREAHLSLITTVGTETALRICLWSRPAIMGNHLGSWVGQPWAKDTVGKLWKERNKLGSWLLCWAPWSSIHPTLYFPFIWTNKFPFLWRQTLLSFLLFTMDPIPTNTASVSWCPYI